MSTCDHFENTQRSVDFYRQSGSRASAVPLLTLPPPSETSERRDGCLTCKQCQTTPDENSRGMTAAKWQKAPSKQRSIKNSKLDLHFHVCHPPALCSASFSLLKNKERKLTRARQTVHGCKCTSHIIRKYVYQVPREHQGARGAFCKNFFSCHAALSEYL